MTRLKRRLWLGAALVALVLLGAGSWFYHTIYMTSDFSLRHAEAFLFRRMTVAQLADAYALKCVMHFHHYTMAEQMARHETPIRNTF